MYFGGPKLFPVKSLLGWIPYTGMDKSPFTGLRRQKMNFVSVQI